MLELPLDLQSSNLYLDLAMEFRQQNHDVFVIAPSIGDQKTDLYQERGLNVLRVKALKQSGIKSVFKKGLAQVLLPYQYKMAYLKYLKKEQFDLLLMPTPPITMINVALFVKKRTKSCLYLILRDIYPQGAADLGLVKFKFIFSYLKYIEQKTYKNADVIGCMSQGNIDYISEFNPSIPKNKLVLLPNWQNACTIDSNKVDIREKYNLENKYLVLFGGAIGYAQKVENIILLANQYQSNKQIVFLVIGNGVKKEYLKELAKESQLQNIIFMDSLPREEYLTFVEISDVGLITIDERFTVPTIPSKTTSYFCSKLPILAIIDAHTDYGKILEEANAGLWSVGGDDQKLFANFDLFYNNPELRQKMGQNGFEYFTNNLTSDKAYLNIMNSIKTQSSPDFSNNEYINI